MLGEHREAILNPRLGVQGAAPGSGTSKLNSEGSDWAEGILIKGATDL